MVVIILIVDVQNRYIWSNRRKYIVEYCTLENRGMRNGCGQEGGVSACVYMHVRYVCSFLPKLEWGGVGIMCILSPSVPQKAQDYSGVTWETM